MDYMTLREVGEKWGMPPRWISYYCATRRTPGAVKMATIWLILKTTEKPIDKRTRKGKAVTEWYNETGALWIWF